jgi:DNA-binding NarL/FixJ family response regulator
MLVRILAYRGVFGSLNPEPTGAQDSCSIVHWSRLKAKPQRAFVLFEEIRHDTTLRLSAVPESDHLILMDIGLPRLNDLEAARRIRGLVPSSKIVFLTQETNVDALKEALSLGAWGYIAKDHAGTDLLAGLQAILQGKRFVSDGMDHNGSLARWKGPTD